MDKKKAIKLATASAVAASAFVAANPNASEAATNVATVVSQAKAQFKAVYNTYNVVAQTGKLVDVNKVKTAVANAEKAYANAVAVVKKAGGSKKDAYLADLQKTYTDYVVKGGKNYINAYNSLVKLDQLHTALKDAVAQKDLAKVESIYHQLSAVLKKIEAVVKPIYGQAVRAALLDNVDAAKATKDGLIYDVTVYMKLNAADAAIKADKLADADKALADAAKYLPQATTFKAELTAQQATVKAAYDAKVTPKVESVSANNLKVVTVKFNKEIDSTTLTANTVKVYVNSSTTATTVDTTPSSVAAGQVGYILGEDKKTLSIVFGTALNQSDNVKVVVDGVKTTNQATVEKNETTLTLTDTTAPVAEKVEVVNNKKVKLYFNEPVNLDTAGIYKTTDVANAGVSLKVDGSLSFAKFTPVPEQNAVEVEFFNALADGSHTIEVSDVKDFAGFKASAKSFTINTAADTKAPVATSIEYVSRTQIKVHFDEALKDAGGSTPTGTFEVYEAGNNANLFSSASLSTDGKTVTINVNPAFTVAATVGLDVKYKNVEDIFGNKTTDFVTISGKAVDDAAKPTVSSVEVLDGNVLKVTFSEKVNVAGQTANFKLYKEDGKTVVASAAASVVDYDNTNPDGKTFKVTFNELSNVDSANYKLKVTGIKDTSIRQNTIDDVMLPFTSKDSKAPQLVTAVLKADASGNNDKIELVFSEAMDQALVSNVANYFIGNNNAATPLNTVSGAKVDSVSADGKKVTLLVPDADDSNGTGGLSFAVNRIAMPALKDLAGNYITGASISTPANVSTSYPTYSHTDFDVEATAPNKVTIKFKDGVNGFFSYANANQFKFTTDNSTTVDLGVVAAQISADGRSVTLTTSRPLNDDALYSTYPALKLFIDNNAALGSAVKDQNNEAITFGIANAISVTDKIKPTLTGQVTASISGSTSDTVTVNLGSDKLSAVIDLTSKTTTTTDSITLAFNTSESSDLTFPVIIGGSSFATLTTSNDKAFTAPTVTLADLQAAAKLDNDGDDTVLTLVGTVDDDESASVGNTNTVTIKVKVK